MVRSELFAAIAAAIVIALAAGTFIAVSIGRGLGKAVGMADAVAQGDLTRVESVRSNDEISDLIVALTAMSDRLRPVVADTRPAERRVGKEGGSTCHSRWS